VKRRDVQTILSSKIIAIGVIALTGFLSHTQAALTLDFIYNPAEGTAGSVTIEYDMLVPLDGFDIVGSGVPQSPVNQVRGGGLLVSSGADNLAVEFRYKVKPDVPDVPWSQHITDPVSVTGAAFGFNNRAAAPRVFLPVGYTVDDFNAGTSIAGSFVFAETSLADFGFGSTNLSLGTGSFDAGFGEITWTTSAVPEPSSYSILAGVLALACCAARRRR